MGLDNCIILRKITDNVTPEIAFKNCQYEKDDLKITSEDFNIPEDEVVMDDLCYWRKSWNIRDAFLSVIGKTNNDKNSEYYYLITEEDIPAIMKNIFKLCDKNTWDDSNDSIWEFKDIKERLINTLVNLKLLKLYLHKHKDVIALFVDSY